MNLEILQTWMTRHNIDLKPEDKYKAMVLLIEFREQVLEEERKRVEQARLERLYGH